MSLGGKRVAMWLVVVFCLTGCAVAVLQVSVAADVGESALARAICPIVYPVDETPGGHGYQYAFYGNAFFISREGYLITAAHVLHSFSNGGQPYILVTRNEAPPVMLKAEVVAVNREHDVAVLRATPNPFAGNYRVGSFRWGRKRRREATAWWWRRCGRCDGNREVSKRRCKITPKRESWTIN